MRISRNPEDPGNYLYNTVKDRGFRVTLNGTEFPSDIIILADDSLHIVITEMRRGDVPVAFEGEIKEITHRGHVAIEIDPEMHEHVVDTQKHVDRVRVLLKEFCGEMIRRGDVHDASKFGPDEAPAYARVIPELKKLQIGTPEYAAKKDELGSAFMHHVAENDHHIEHHGAAGIAGMTLFSLVELFFDSKAASERGADPGMNLTYLSKKHSIDPQLESILRNTARVLGYTVV